MSHCVQVPIKGMGVDEIVREKKSGLTLELRKTSAFTHWVKEVKPEKEIEGKLSGLDCTEQKQ